MIKHNLKIFSQNVRKNKTLTDIILETRKNISDIILIQEPPRTLLRHIPSHTNPEGDPFYGMPNHPDWSLFIQNDDCIDNYPRVATYINRRISRMRFSLRKDLINHRDISVIDFHNGQNVNFIINVYSDSNQTALRVLQNNIRNIRNTVIMTGDFNIRNSDWDPNIQYHSIHTEDLMFIADSLDLELATPINPGPTRFADNQHDTNSVLDLVFMNPNNPGFNKHILNPDIRLPSDHVPLIIEVGIKEENVNITFKAIKKDSKEEEAFIRDLVKGVRNIDTSKLKNQLDIQRYAVNLEKIFKDAWSIHSTTKRITKHSKEWWNEQCTDCINKYHETGDINSWKSFKSAVRSAKRSFFDQKIQEIAMSNKRPWDLMNWVKKKSLPAIETIYHKGQPCNNLSTLWNALHNSYNSAENRPIDTRFLDGISQCNDIEWPPFTDQEFVDAIAKCSNTSSPGPDHVTWRHIKHLTSDKTCLSKIVNIANTCISIGYWPKHFKESTSIIIPKPNKMSYNTTKAFRPIILLNTMDKLIEKVISHRLQFHLSANGFLDPNQMGGIRQRSTIDAGIYLTHLIRTGWAKECHTSVIAFDIA